MFSGSSSHFPGTAPGAAATIDLSRIQARIQE